MSASKTVSIYHPLVSVNQHIYNSNHSDVSCLIVLEYHKLPSDSSGDLIFQVLIRWWYV